MAKKHFFDSLWDIWCVASIIGIWPRFIEPNLLQTSKITLPLPKLPKELDGFKIAQFSDLHLNASMSDRFLDKIHARISNEKPDLILFTGDFLCFGEMKQKDRLLKFLNRFQAPYGCYAILGNHDYEKCVGVNESGEYDVIDAKSANILKGFQRLFSKSVLQKRATERAKRLKPHPELLSLLKQTPFTLLHNESCRIPVGTGALNLCGLGEYMLEDHDTAKAFANYDSRYPGILLAHNPDTAPSLSDCPGELILSGHTHGAQINLPYFRKKFMILEQEQLVKGLHQTAGKWIYINRGVGSTFPFRWFSPPEILFLTLSAS